ncbi:hypothetical protein CCAX7_54370 [Capsulimonas corticalis]|uniref:Fibronectin type-III domain-containing protein n=1 Tax=Capsulimonas corticalis TaxID=2219043 RepID=A0A9N7QGB9_9BACT|nr:hypothetical protein [Capsulimonas corticalis]BDI33386.1 hypothetical protein CCAX7_54370 [Capsulimonas corticalis]
MRSLRSLYALLLFLIALGVSSVVLVVATPKTAAAANYSENFDGLTVGNQPAGWTLNTNDKVATTHPGSSPNSLSFASGTATGWYATSYGACTWHSTVYYAAASSQTYIIVHSDTNGNAYEITIAPSAGKIGVRKITGRAVTSGRYTTVGTLTTLGTDAGYSNLSSLGISAGTSLPTGNYSVDVDISGTTTQIIKARIYANSPTRNDAMTWDTTVTDSSSAYQNGFCGIVETGSGAGQVDDVNILDNAPVPGFTVAATSGTVYANGTTQSVTVTPNSGTTLSTTASFTISGGTGASTTPISTTYNSGPGTYTLTYNPGTLPTGAQTFTDTTDSFSATFTPTAPSFTRSPTTLAANNSAQTVTIVGTGTNFNTGSTTQFTMTGGTGASIVSQSASSTTAATLSINPGTASGATLTITGPSGATQTITTTTPAALTAGTITPTAGVNQITFTATDATNGVLPYAYQVQISTDNATFSTPGAGSGLTTRSGTITGLTNGTTYYVRMRYTDNASTVVTSASVSVTPSATPALVAGYTSVTYAAAASGTVKLSWTAATGNSGSLTYVVNYGTAPTSLSTASSSQSATTFTLGSQTNGTALYFQVVASDSGGSTAASYPIVGAIPSTVSSGTGRKGTTHSFGRGRR